MSEEVIRENLRNGFSEDENVVQIILDISHNLNNIKLNEFVSIVQKVMLVLGHFHVFVA